MKNFRFFASDHKANTRPKYIHRTEGYAWAVFGDTEECQMMVASKEIFWNSIDFVDTEYGFSSPRPRKDKEPKKGDFLFLHDIEEQSIAAIAKIQSIDSSDTLFGEYTTRCTLRLLSTDYVETPYEFDSESESPLLISNDTRLLQLQDILNEYVH